MNSKAMQTTVQPIVDLPRRSALLGAIAGSLAMSTGVATAQENLAPVVRTLTQPPRGRMRPERVQLLFADLQAGLVAGSRTMPPTELATAVAALAAAAQILSLPMTFSLVPEAGRWGRALPELASYVTSINAFWRTTASAFMDRSTVDHLDSNGRTILILSGFAAEVVVLHSALGAIDAGYDVHVPVDAIGGISERTQEAVLRQIERAGGTVTSIHSVITQIAPDLGAPPGSTALDALRVLRAS